MPKGEHFKKVTKKDKSFIIRFTSDEAKQIDNFCTSSNINKTEFIRKAIFKAITTILPKEQSKPLPDTKNTPQTTTQNHTAKDLIIELYQKNNTVSDIVEYLKSNNIVNRFGANYNYDTVNKLLFRNKLK
jgi:hypothetical protein